MLNCLKFEELLCVLVELFEWLWNSSFYNLGHIVKVSVIIYYWYLEYLFIWNWGFVMCFVCIII